MGSDRQVYFGVDFGTTNSSPNVDLGAGFININAPATGNSNAFNMPHAPLL